MAVLEGRDAGRQAVRGGGVTRRADVVPAKDVRQVAALLVGNLLHDTHADLREALPSWQIT